MDAATAASIINSTYPRPNYRHEAHADYDGKVSVRIRGEAFESRVWPHAKVSSTTDNGGGYRFDPSDLRDEADVTHALVQAYLSYERHELREFLKRGSDGKALLHPHRVDGTLAWLDADMRAKDRVDEDQGIGIGAGEIARILHARAKEAA